jgi:hypothetical protein
MSSIIGQVSYPVFVAGVYVFFIIVSIFSFIVGIGLATRSATMLRFFNFMNRQYSVRRALKPLADPLVEPHYIEPEVFRHPTLFGGGITLGALVSIVFLYGIDAAAYQPVYYGSFDLHTSEILANYTRKVLLLGNAGCVALGLIVLFFPRQLSSIEAYADNWFKSHNKTRSLYMVRFEVDHWVLAHPTVSGIALSLMSLGLAFVMYLRL